MRVCKCLRGGGRRKEIETRNGRRERVVGRGETMRRPGTEEQRKD